MSDEEEKTFYPEKTGWTKLAIWCLCKDNLVGPVFNVDQLTDEDAQEFVDLYHEVVDTLWDHDQEDNGAATAVREKEKQLAIDYNHKIQTRFTEW